MKHALAHRAPSGPEEDRAPHEHGNRPEAEVQRREEVEEWSAPKPGVHRDREYHRVHRDCGAHAEPPKKVVRCGVRALDRRAEQIPEALHAGDEGAQIEVGLHDEVDAAQRRVDLDVLTAVRAPEQLLDEPHATDAVQPLDVERGRVGPSALRRRSSRPSSHLASRRNALVSATGTPAPRRNA